MKTKLKEILKQEGKIPMQLIHEANELYNMGLDLYQIEYEIDRELGSSI